MRYILRNWTALPKTFWLCLAVCAYLSCTVTKPVKTGDMAFEFKQYALAVELLEEEYNRENNSNVKARKASYLAKSYDILEMYGEALKWYDIADQLIDSEATKNALARALKRNERYKDAVVLYDDLYKRYRDINYRRQAEICRMAHKQVQKQDNFKIELASFNTEYGEYSPVYYQDNFTVFTSDRPGSTGDKVYKWNDRGFSDIYVSDQSGRQVYGFDAILNSEHNEGTPAFSKDFEEIFFTRCYSPENRDQFCKLYYSQKPNGFWLEPEALMFYDDKTNFAHPCLIEQDSVLIFTAKTQGSDNYDLYYAVRVEKGWTEAEIMPSNINSTGDEMFPTSYGDTLYFSSDGHIGFGGLDIFKTYLKEDGSWSDPENMSWPINSGADDFGLVLKPNYEDDENTLLKGMFSSSRNTASSTDVFMISVFEEADIEEVVEEEPEEVVSTPKKDYLIYLAGRVVEQIREAGDPNAAVIAKEPIREGVVEIESLRDTSVQNLDLSGRFLKRLSSGGEYVLTARNKEYLSNSITISLPEFSELSGDTTINVELVLDRIVYDTEIILSNIYYDFDRWEIREDAEAPLDSLSSILKLNPQLDIQLASHTDCRGEEDYNLDLSQKRAQSVVDYLIDSGIDSSRMNAVGFGESQMKINCVCEDCTEEDHQANRRTTFKILKPE